MATPSVATLKRLFALSSNSCAFPKCTNQLVHEGKVTGRVCHIKAASPGGPRYDPGQAEEERHNFENLVLMCPIHHDVIDADEEAYTVERLRKIKEGHEGRSQSMPELSSDAAAQFINNIGPIGVVAGSVVITNKQSGGQAAHIINNYGPTKRQITETQREQMLSFLASAPKAKIGFASTQGDVEAQEYKEQLISVFRQAGWPVSDLSTFMIFGSKKGLVITIPFNAPELGMPQVVLRALQITGSPVAANRGDMANECEHYVQVWHAP